VRHQIGKYEYSMHPGMCERCRLVDAANGRMTVWAAHECRVQHARQPDVVDKTPAAPQQSIIFEPGYAFAPFPPRPACGERVGVRGMQLTQNFLQHSIGLFQHDIIPKPNYPKAFRFKTSCSLAIAGSLLGMLPAIQFHNQLLLEADEINDVWWNRVLSPKLKSAEVTVFQLQPEPQFRIG